jgi:DNA-binding NarL/FixJ family response regulator
MAVRLALPSSSRQQARLRIPARIHAWQGGGAGLGCALSEFANIRDTMKRPANHHPPPGVAASTPREASSLGILIADDHAIFRRGLRDILIERFPEASFGEADTAQGVLELVWKRKWDLLVLDISMPGRSGLDVLKDVKQAQPRLPVLVLSMHPEDQYAVRVLKAGAAGYLTKVNVPEEMVRAVTKVLAGGRYVSGALAERLAAELSTGGTKLPHETLSDREFQLLRRIAAGKTVKEIAGELSLSVQTVSTYRARVLTKLHLHTTAELMRYALDHRLAD